MAVEMLEAAQSETILAGVSPTSAAAAALYAAGRVYNKDFTQDEIAEVAGVTHVTIRYHYRDLLAVFEETT